MTTQLLERNPLSQKQSEILDYMREYCRREQCPPTIRDIQDDCDISSTSVVDYNLKALARRGLIKKIGSHYSSRGYIPVYADGRCPFCWSH